MEVKIGVQYAPRELVLESAENADEIAEAVTAAVKSEQGTLSLQDDRGRRVIIPVDKLAYVEIGEPVVRGVGFSASS
ncbi:uncharacterized protein DUF3107 [Stackebrandtia endophytica]|uniref:Uncharacterized protein DUF3107 n=1 Tax=Stackebrandtia endophytica TaxID=1496996 RepID=A0A543ASZ0_9ACTN|nr:DUF3107 domain-containing protein [Stackebrandtia endophytica]TQL75693.1 uncharacterized protein DUF3107 [Stackebrandtia endophytica]